MLRHSEVIGRIPAVVLYCIAKNFFHKIILALEINSVLAGAVVVNHNKTH